ncbi:RxLR effector protein [Phytophthora megakarya]|uniref:RxLR effector protein n=1 Tax=Phytophthora megakarya TaxID=4795 RepID=A0A225WNU1_9STRA|nr:RxLR effector protein [Phytophthora megakarya]
MHLHYVMVMIVVILAAASGVLETKVMDTNLRNVDASTQINSINTVPTEISSGRKLRGADINADETNVHYYPSKGKKKTFIEDRIKKALSNPKKTRKLYEQWYQSGFTPKQVARGLTQDDNRGLDETYKRVAKGYAVFIQEKRSQKPTMWRL